MTGCWTAVFWKMQKMTNSAGRTGAIPISQISRPLTMSSWVIVDWAKSVQNIQAQTATAAIAATTSATSAAGTACRVRLMPTDPKYTAST